MQPECHKFDISDDCLAVEDMLRYMSDRVRICSLSDRPTVTLGIILLALQRSKFK